MPQITIKETITKKVEIPIDTLYKLIDNLPDEDRKKLLKRLKERQPVKLKPFKKDKLGAILRDFAETDLYEDNFLQDLEEGLNKSSILQSTTVNNHVWCFGRRPFVFTFATAKKIWFFSAPSAISAVNKKGTDLTAASGP
jgi:hypothetical protein